MSTARREPRWTRQPRGLSLLEVVVSTMLVSVVLVTAVKCLGTVLRGRSGTGQKARAMELAQQLMTEILNAQYKDPGPAPVFGLEPGESQLNRMDFDDVDDYHGWSKSPPQYRDGSPVRNGAGWQRDVAVAWANPSNPATDSASDQALKRITVTVRYNGSVVAELVALSSKQ